MLARYELRKEAYKYTLEILGKLPAGDTEKNQEYSISLDELRQLKEGTNDPSPELVLILHEWLDGIVSDTEIDNHLVKPFTNEKLK